MPPSKRKQTNKSNGEQAAHVKAARARATAASSAASTDRELDDAMQAEPNGALSFAMAMRFHPARVSYTGRPVLAAGTGTSADGEGAAAHELAGDENGVALELGTVRFLPSHPSCAHGQSDRTCLANPPCPSHSSAMQTNIVGLVGCCWNR